MRSNTNVNAIIIRLKLAELSGSSVENVGSFGISKKVEKMTEMISHSGNRHVRATDARTARFLPSAGS